MSTISVLCQLYNGNGAPIGFIFITSRQLLISCNIDNRFSPGRVASKKTEKWLKMGIAFATSRFNDNAYRCFFCVGNADDNFRGLARCSPVNPPTSSGTRRSRSNLFHCVHEHPSRNFLSLALLYGYEYAKLGASRTQKKKDICKSNKSLARM